MHSYPLNNVKNHPSAPIHLKDRLDKATGRANRIHLEGDLEDRNRRAHKISIKNRSVHLLSDKINPRNDLKDNNDRIKGAIDNNRPTNNLKDRLAFHHDPPHLLGVKDRAQAD
jgi:hypothetical protein